MSSKQPWFAEMAIGALRTQGTKDNQHSFAVSEQIIFESSESESHWAFKTFYAKSRLSVFVEYITEKAFEQFRIQKRPSSHSADIRPEVGNGESLTPVRARSDINEQYIAPWEKKDVEIFESSTRARMCRNHSSMTPIIKLH